MPVCVCVKRGQVRRDDGFIRFYEEGEKETFAKCPALFIPLSQLDVAHVDLGRVSEDIMRDNELIPLDRLIAFYKAQTGEDLTGESRNRVVDKVLYARYNPMSTMSDRGQAPLAHEMTKVTPTGSPLGVDLDKIGVELSSEESNIPSPEPEEDTVESGLDDLLSS